MITNKLSASLWRYQTAYKAMFLLACTAISNAALAVNEMATININGVIIESLCTISSANKTISVDMQEVTPKDFPAVGATSDTSSLQINLSNCPASAPQVTVRFDGTADANNPALLALTTSPADGGASGLGIEFLDKNNASIPLSNESSLYSIAKGDNALQFWLRYKSTGVVSAGDASSTATFTLNYK